MIRTTVLALVLLATPSFAQDDHADHADHGEHAHDDHVAELDGVRALHAWVQATDARTALVFLEIENAGDGDATLLGGETEIASAVTLVGFTLSDGQPTYVAIPEMPVVSDVILDPNGLALQLEGLSEALHQGESFSMTLEFDVGQLPITVEVEAEGATQHSHAGHQH